MFVSSHYTFESSWCINWTRGFAATIVPTFFSNGATTENERVRETCERVWSTRRRSAHVRQDNFDFVYCHNSHDVYLRWSCLLLLAGYKKRADALFATNVIEKDIRHVFRTWINIDRKDTLALVRTRKINDMNMTDSIWAGVIKSLDQRLHDDTNFNDPRIWYINRCRATNIYV